MNDAIPGLEEPEGQLTLPTVTTAEEDMLSTLLRLSNKLVELQELADRQALELETTQRAIKDLSESRLPALLDALGIDTFQLRSGRKISVKTEYYASIPKAREEEAFAWLKERNMDGAVKKELRVDAGMEDVLREAQINYAVERKIHPSTLKALVREQIEAGNEFPRELFGVHEIERVVVK